ncbi:MAG TPA: hypothetical protein DCQ98_01150 [Planctomycetaceae bacterium]|nr:hypothetical protein [Planctomycetaceae bacterium]
MSKGSRQIEMPTVYLTAEKRQAALEAAQELFLNSPDWLVFFRRTLGIDGKIRQLFPTQEEFVAFERTEEFSQIQQMVAALRALKKNPPLNAEPTRVITVRLPKSVHEALRAEANDHDISMNWLCIAKLLQAFQDDNLPTPPGQVRKKPFGSPQIKVVSTPTSGSSPYPTTAPSIPHRVGTVSGSTMTSGPVTMRIDSANPAIPRPHFGNHDRS